MVFRILIARCGLSIISLLLIISTTTFAVSTAQAKIHGYIRAREGDPGDGVLQPAPVVDPKPLPTGGNYASRAFDIRLIPLGNGSFLPIFELIDLSSTTVFPLGQRTIQEGRLHRAP